MELKTLAIVQARNGASRLPGKVLLKILDKTILEYGIERIKRARSIEGLVIATTVNKNDLSIVELASSKGVGVYRGSEDDVLDRYYQAARSFKADHIVRITADCPLIDPGVIDAVIQRYRESKADYCANTLKETFPDGQDVEVFSFNALKIAWQNARLASEREHVTPYIRKHTEQFKLASFENPTDLSAKRWTLDEEKDFIVIKNILEALYPKNPLFTMDDVLKYLSENSDIEKINSGIARNEGYAKSLKQDKIITP